VASVSKAVPAPPAPSIPSVPSVPSVPYASGTLHARVALVGQGRSVAEVLGSADGQLQASLTDATLSHLLTEAAGLDLGQALGVFIRGDRSLNLRCARMQAQVSKGVVGPVQGLLDNNDSALKIDGQIDLRNEAMDLRLVARPKDFSPLSLRSPVHVRGTLSQPRLSVEGGPIAARVLGALALGAVAPLLAWIPLVDTGGADQPDACAQAAVAVGTKQKAKSATPAATTAATPTARGAAR
jgi:AsmA family protein